MNNQKYIENVLEDFYLSTNLPIQAFSFDGHNIGHKGYDDRLNQLFENYNVYEKVKKALGKSDIPLVTVMVYHNVYCTACYIKQNNQYSSLFVLGPHSCRENNPMNITYKPKCLIKHLVALLRIISKDNSYSDNLRCMRKKAYSLHVKRAIDHVNYRYKEGISLDTMVDYLGINKSYFCSIFKKETGQTFTQFLNGVRIEKSKQLLLETDNSVLDIALSVGFNNQNYYNIQFKKFIAMSPLEFKRRNDYTPL